MPTQAELDAIEDAIITAAGGPHSVTIDGNTVTGHDIGDLVKAAQHLAAPPAAAKPHFGLRFTQLVPPGAG